MTALALSPTPFTLEAKTAWPRAVTTVASVPRVAIVVVNFRTPAMTVECVRSLQQLRYPACEIVLVENASGDDSEAIFRRELPEVTLLVAASNGGYTAGNNIGIAWALERGFAYIHIVNPDVIVLNPNYLTSLVAYLESEPEVGQVGPRVHLRQRGNVQDTVLVFPWFWRRAVDWVRFKFTKPRPRSGERVRTAELLNGVCVLFRAQALRQVGLFDEQTFAYVEDVDWAWRAHQAGYHCVYLPVESILHLQKESGYDKGGKVDYLLKRNTLYFLRKAGKHGQAAAYTLVILTGALVRVALNALRLRPVAPATAWLRKIAKTFWCLWTGQTNRVMGVPRV